MGEKQTMGGDNAGVVLHPTSQSLIYFLYPVRGGVGEGVGGYHDTSGDIWNHDFMLPDVQRF
jgi:hypothetical protein